jgi:c-di-GMP-binding flagellar brake protein YcgR
MVVQVTEEGGKHMISPQARVLHIEEYRKGRSRCGVVFVEIPKRLRRKSVQAVVTRLGRDARFLGVLPGPRTLRDPAFTHSLLNLWAT